MSIQGYTGVYKDLRGILGTLYVVLHKVVTKMMMNLTLLIIDLYPYSPFLTVFSKS